MQVSDLNSPVISHRLLAQHQQCSPGIDQLIQKAEFENAEQVRLIETEKQRYAALLRQLDEKTRQTEELEKSTTQLDEEAKQLHKQFTQNREICESLKRTNGVLQEHEEALQKKKAIVLANLQQVRLQNQSVLAKYEGIWSRYKKRYESKTNAEELIKIKEDAMRHQGELDTIRLKVQQLETGISSMEEEKRNIEESADKEITSAVPVIIKLAQLNLETRKTEDCLQEITTKIKDSKEEEQARMSASRESQSNNYPDEALSKDVPPSTPIHMPMRASLQLTSPHVDSRPSAQNQNDTDMEAESGADRNASKQQQHAPVPKRTHPEQLPTDTTNQQSRHFTEDQTSVTHTECYIQPHLKNATEPLENSGSTAPKSSHHDEEQTFFPTTPTSTGHHGTDFTPSSEAINSPFNFERHSDMIQQLTKSPGDGFLFQSRPMFDNGSMDKENDQANKENAPFLFNMQETRNISGPTGTDLFGPPVSGESRSDGAGFFTASMSPSVGGCSIFGDAGPNQQTGGSTQEFSFSFGASSPNANSNSSTEFSLF